MTDKKSVKLDSCGCCGEEVIENDIYNRPGLDEIEYRVGEYGKFFTAMLERLPKEIVEDAVTGKSKKPLFDLTTRSKDDPIIALLDSWSCTLDVLSFYSERGANESFLRTATERRSVLELARAIGYELKPGVAASAYLQFTVEDRDDPFRTTTIPAGTQVLSIPVDGGLPQTFETMEDIKARAEWNKIKARLGLSQILALYKGEGEDDPINDGLYLIDVDGSLDLGEDEDLEIIDVTNQSKFYQLNPLLSLTEYLNDSIDTAIHAIPVTEIYFDGVSNNISLNDRIVLAGQNSNNDIHALPGMVEAVSTDNEVGRTHVDIKINSVTTKKKKKKFKMPVLQSGMYTSSVVSFNSNNVAATMLGSVWSQNSFKAMVKKNKWKGKYLKTLVAKIMQGKALGSASSGIFILRKKSGFFGHNAPRQEMLPITSSTRASDDPYKLSWDKPQRNIWEDSQGQSFNTVGHDVYLEQQFDEIVPDSWAVFEEGSVRKIYRISEVFDVSRTDYSLSGKSSALGLNDISGGAAADKSHKFINRKTTAYVQSERLQIAELPVPDVVTAGTQEIMLDELILNLEIGQSVYISGERDDAPGITGIELKVLKEVMHYGGYTVLEFETALQHDYLRKTISVNANVVLATHGESAQQSLGNGNAAQPNQSFKLNKAPLTYVSSSSPDGVDSSLLVRVNDVEWDEVRSLHDKTESDTAYIVRHDEEGIPHITFGDGVHGARLPTGQLNITAEYRSGIGFDGEVGEETLALLKTRPLGISRVINPLGASGAEDPENLDSARHNAPLTVRTLDRIVSITDYEDFANSFAGIGKAKAVSIWNGEASLVNVTAASASGEAITKSDNVHANLLAAMNSVRDLSVELNLAGMNAEPSFVQTFFDVSAKVSINEKYISDLVIEDIKQALIDTFSFSRRQFGQPVTLAEVMTLIQSIDGVIFVDVDELYTVGQAEALNEILLSKSAQWDSVAKKVDLAELLLINDAGISIVEMGNA